MIEPPIQAIDIVHDVSPPISTLSVDELVEGKDRPLSGTPPRLLMIGIMVSVLVHLAIVLIVIKVSRSRTVPLAESPRVSVQIRITSSSQSPIATPTPATSEPVTSAAADSLPDTSVIPTDNGRSTDAASSETGENSAVAIEPADREVGGDGATATRVETQTVTAPSMTDIRQAVRSLNANRNENRQPDCSPWMMRHDMFTHCEPEADTANYDQASRASVLAPLIPGESPVEPAAPGNTTDTGQRLQSLLDRIDDRFSTSRTRRSIMQLP